MFAKLNDMSHKATHVTFTRIRTKSCRIKISEEFDDLAKVHKTGELEKKSQEYEK